MLTGVSDMLMSGGKDLAMQAKPLLRPFPPSLRCTRWQVFLAEAGQPVVDANGKVDMYVTQVAKSPPPPGAILSPTRHPRRGHVAVLQQPRDRQHQDGGNKGHIYSWRHPLQQAVPTTLSIMRFTNTFKSSSKQS